MTLELTGKGLTVEDVVKVARGNEEVKLHPDSEKRIKKCRDLLERKMAEGEVMYGVNTGIGELAEVILSEDQVKKFQKYLIYSHAAGIGEPMKEEYARAAMLSRISVHCHGHSGMRLKITNTMLEMLNKGVSPVMCQKGSVGACGDLSPMSQMALSLMGEGEVFYKSERMPSKTGLEKAGIEPVIYQERDGLATINGSNCITGMGCLHVHDSQQWMKQHDIAASMTLEVLHANTMAFDRRIHELRGFPGAIKTAENLRNLLRDSKILAKAKKKVQDAYSLRSIPQVAGAARDSLKWARYMMETELNACADNPTFFPEEDLVISGANFQGTPMALALENVGTAMTTVAALSERRLNRLMNPALSVGLPAYLTEGAGMYSGLMLTQYTAGSLVCENRVMSHPAATGSIPAAADQEDFVSMGMTTAIKTGQIIENAQRVLAIELIAAAQALEFRGPEDASPANKIAYDVIRKHVEPLEEDRPTYNDLNRMSEVVKSGEILKAVEKETGRIH